MKVNFNSKLVWTALAIFFIATLIGTWGYYFPKKHLFACNGREYISRTNKLSGWENLDWRPSEEFVRVYEYWWGLQYSIDNFSLEECTQLLEMGPISFCSTGDRETPSYRYASFDLDEGKYSYEWSHNGSNEVTEYSGNSFRCEKTSRAIDK